MFPVCKQCKLFQQTRRLLLTQLKGETNKKGIDDHSDTSPCAFSLCRNKLNFCAATNGPGSQGRSVNEVVILFPDPWLMSVEGKKTTTTENDDDDDVDSDRQDSFVP